MVKKRILLIPISIIFILIFIKIEFLPFFPLSAFKELNLPNTTIYYYKVDSTIRNKDDFIDFLKENSDKYELGSYMNNEKKVNWDKVLKETHVYFKGWRRVYSIHYETLDPECNGYKLDITSNGYIRDYRSAGK